MIWFFAEGTDQGNSDPWFLFYMKNILFHFNHIKPLAVLYEKMSANPDDYTISTST